MEWRNSDLRGRSAKLARTDYCLSDSLFDGRILHVDTPSSLTLVDRLFLTRFWISFFLATSWLFSPNPLLSDACMGNLIWTTHSSLK